MSRDDPGTKFTEVELNDAHFKLKLYYQKLGEEADPHIRKEKLCHLAAETSLKYCDSVTFPQENYETLKTLLYSQKSYYLLYILDILLKNHRANLGK